MELRQRIRQALRPIVLRMLQREILGRFAWWGALGVVLGILGYGLPAWGRLGLPEWLSLVFLGVCLTAGLVAAARVRVSDRQAARALDARLGLKEELGTAVELAIAGERSVLADTLMGRAADRCDSIDPRAVVPHLSPPLRRFRLVGLIALVGAVATLTAAYWPLPPEEQAARQAMKRQAQKIEEIAKEIRREAPKALQEDAERLAKRLEKLSREFQKGRASKREGLEALAELSDQLQAQQDTLAQDANMVDVRQALGKLRDSSFASSDLAEVADLIEANQFREAQDALKQLAEKLRKGELSQADREQLARDLGKMAQALAASNALSPASERLRGAAEALKAGDTQKAAKLAQGAAEQLSQALEGSEVLSDAQALERMLQDLEGSMDDVSGASEDGAGRDRSGASDGSGRQKPSEMVAGGDEFDPNAPGGPGPGGGSTNEAQATGPEGQKGSEDIYGKDTPVEGQYEELYASRETEHGSRNTRVRGMPRSKGDSAYVDIRMPPVKSEAFSPSFDVGEAAGAAAEDAVEGDSVPRAYRERVRSYFETLE